jgi:hypothetical protein
MFLINGVINAQGNQTNLITFDGNGDSIIFKTNHPLSQGGFLNLDNCIIKNAQSAFWFDNTGYLNLTNSLLTGLSQPSYLLYPAQDTYIEYNTFVNSSGIRIGTDDYFSNSPGMVYVKYNLFTSNQGYFINNFASYGVSKISVNNNSFTNTNGVVLEVEKDATTADMNASLNYWGTSDTAVIASMIYDKNNNVSCSSYINYLPILNAPDPQVPIAPTPTPTPEPTLPPTSPAPSSTPTSSETPFPLTSAEPTTSPTTTPTDTPSSTTSTTPSPSPSSSSPTSSPPNPTNQDSTTQNANTISNTNPSATPTIPELPFLATITLLISSLIGAIALRKRQSKKSA